ncbi:MAG: hypothetical protein AAF927_08795 [Bacteroidota bacterium]
MKTISFILAILAVNLCFGQGPDSTKVQELYSAFNENLALRAEQQQPVLDLLYATAAELSANYSLKQSDVQAFRQQKKQIHQNMRNQMGAILDAEQMATFEAAIQQRRATRKGKSGKKGKQAGNSPNTNLELAPPANQLGVDALARSIDFLFDEVLTPTVRNRVKGQ